MFDSDSGQSLLSQANLALRNGNFAHALDLYSQMIADSPQLEKIIRSNVNLIEHRLSGGPKPADVTAKLQKLKIQLTPKMDGIVLDWINHFQFHKVDSEQFLAQLLNSKDAQDFINVLFLVGLGRSPKEHEQTHYVSQIETVSASHFQIADLILSGKECAQHQKVKPQALKPLAAPKKMSFVLPKIGDIKPMSLALPQCANPLVSVLIPVYEKLEYTLACLQSIAKHLPKASFEVLVLDDYSPDGSNLELEKIANLRVIRNPKNLGFLQSCNHGVSFANGRYLFFLNNDTLVEDGWLDELLATYDQFDNVGIVGSKLVYPDGLLQEAGAIIWDDGFGWNYGRGLDPKSPEFNFVREVDYCSGAAILIEKSLFECAGGFDEQFSPAYYEDSDLAFKVRQLGKKVLYQPRSVVVHFEGVSHGTDSQSGLKAYQEKNRQKFLHKWSNDLVAHHFAHGKNHFLARDRSAIAKTVLIVDHYLPQPDRDAGSKSMMHIIKALLNQGLRVKFWPHNHHYDPAYAPLLERLGVEVLAGNRMVGHFEQWIEEHGKHIDSVILSRPGVAVDFVSPLKKYSRANIIYYGHDIHHLRIQKQHESSSDKALLEKIEMYTKLEQQMWHEIDTIYYPSIDEEEYIRAWLKKERIFGKKVRTIPLYGYNEFPEQPWSNLASRKDLIFVAGFNHPPNIDAAKWFVADVFPLILEKCPDVRLQLVGSNPGEEILNLKSKAIAVTGFVTDERLNEIYDAARVSVVPLLYGGGMKGKILETMYFGLPFVTTSTGAQGLAAAKSFVLSSDKAKDFALRVVHLIKDDDFWIKQSRQGQEFIKMEFSQSSLWDKISADFSLKNN